MKYPQHVPDKRNGRGVSRRPGRSRSGFTLIEVAIASVVVALSVMAIMAAQQAMHRQNDHAGHLQTALSLANEIRETMLGLPINDPISGTSYYGPESNEVVTGNPNQDIANYDDLDDFGGDYGSGTTLNPPINALRQTIPNMENWTQTIKVESVPVDNLTGQGTPYYPGSEMMRITVRVWYKNPADEQSREITRLTWVSPGGL